MSLSNELVSQFAKITNDDKKTRVEETTLYGTVLEYEDSICVKFDGSSEITPVTTITEKDEDGNTTNYKYGAASVKTGDRVSVLLKNHSATITGNLSNPSVGNTEMLVMEDSIVARINGDVKMEIDKLGVTVNGILTVTNGLSDGTTIVNGACIKTGTIEAKYINLTGALTFSDLSDADEVLDSIPTKTSELTNDSGYQTASQVTSTVTSQGYITSSAAAGLISNTLASGGYVTSSQVTTITYNAISTASISANQITTGTLQSAYVKLDGLLQILAYGSTTLGYIGGSNTIANGPGAVICGPSQIAYVRASDDGAKLSYGGTHEIFCQSNGPWSTSDIKTSSDRRLKHDISYDMEKYERFFSALKPCFYHLNNDTEKKYRLGFIAQDVLDGALENDLTEDDLALLGKNGDYYGIGYSELIPLNTHMIQKLMSIVNEQEARITKIESMSQ